MYSIYVYEDYSGYVVLYQGSSLPDRYPVEEATLSEALNASPVLTFSIYDGHPALAALLRLIGAPGVYENSPTIVAYNESADDEQVFSGRIYSHQFDDVTGKHTFVCEGLLSRLNDYPVAPYSYSGTVAGYLQALFNHSEAALTVGNVTVADANDYITRASETPVNLWDEIADKCIGSSLGGYIEIRDGYIVDWLAAPSASTATQDIEKGINLLGLGVEEQPRAKFSGVLVYGAEAGWENQYGQTMYYNLYQYHDWESSLPSGYTMGSYILWNDALREEIGDRVEILHYPDITQPLNLMRRAVSFLQNQAGGQTIQVSAIDMVDAGYGDGIDNIKCGQVIHITGKTVDADRMVTAITRDLLDPSNTTFEFGGSDSISGSGGSGGSGGGGSTTSPHFWHTDVEATSTLAARSLTGFSTNNLDDVITDIGNRATDIDGGAVWIDHNQDQYHGDGSRLWLVASGLNGNFKPNGYHHSNVYLGESIAFNHTDSRYQNQYAYWNLTASTARVNIVATSGTSGYGNINLTASNAVNVSADTNITGNADVSGTLTSNELNFSATGVEGHFSNVTKSSRIAITSSNNLRVDTSSDSGSSWSTHGYAALGTQAPSATAYRAANQVLATPNGSAGLPSMRKLVADDMDGLGDTAYGAGQSGIASAKAAVSCASGTTVNLDTITLAAGTWLVTYSVEWASNASGRRVMTLTTNATSIASTPVYMESGAPANGIATNFSRTQVIVATASTTRYLNALQNSGSALNCRSCIQAVRIA